MTLDGKKIKAMREERGLSQFQLSLEINISREYISQIENNKRLTLSLETAFRLSSYFGIKMEELLQKTDKVVYYE
jgi:transcriptional regulator with XRE-family HTH domain